MKKIFIGLFAALMLVCAGESQAHGQYFVQHSNFQTGPVFSPFVAFPVTTGFGFTSNVFVPNNQIFTSNAFGGYGGFNSNVFVGNGGFGTAAIISGRRTVIVRNGLFSRTIFVH